MSVEVTAKILDFGHRSAKTVVKLMVGLLGLSEIQTEDFIHGFRHASVGHTTYADWWKGNEHYIQGFDVGTAWRETMPRKGERTR
jgi:hypothetical protein